MRRPPQRAWTWLVVACLGSALTACAASPTPIAKRPQASPITPSRLGADLRKLGLDPLKLPRFDDLSPPQLHGVMSTFTRSLGMTCLDCHDAANAQAPTRRKRLAKRMWDEMVRGFRLEGGKEPLYCDSCHHGQTRFLDRSDLGAVSAYMAESYTGSLERADGSEVACATCHGDPRVARFLSTW